MFLLFKEKSVWKEARYQRVPKPTNDKFWIFFMLKFIYFASFLLRTFIHIVVVEAFRGLMLGCGVPYTGFLLKTTLPALFGPSHAGKHPTGNNNHMIFLFFIERICPVSIHSECKAWKCFHCFICNNKLVSQLFEVSCILKGNVVFISNLGVNEGQRMLLSGFSSLRRNVCRSSLDSSCCFLTHFLTLCSPETAILLHHNGGFPPQTWTPLCALHIQL